MVRLFQNWYVDRDAARQAELEECLKRNMDNELIDEIILINEDRHEIGGKSTFVISKDRPTFSHFFALVNNGSDDDINIVANTDIYFEPEDVAKIMDIEDGVAYALSRWDDGKLYDRWDSQDVWAWKGRIGVAADFTMGVPGCDNALAYILSEQFTVLNPSKDIKTHHVHRSGVRNYTRKEVISPPYLLIKPHRLNETAAYRIVQ